VLSIFLLAKGVEIKVNTLKKPETDTSKNRWLALVLVVVGLALGFAGFVLDGRAAPASMSLLRLASHPTSVVRKYRSAVGTKCL
jgi:hypothetical protein